jgi:transposase
VRNARVWRALLGVEKTVIEGVEFDETEQLLVARVRPALGARGLCGVCRRRCAGYDAGEGRRRWRALDAGTVRVFLEADALRRARGGGGARAVGPARRRHTLAFDQTVAWLVTQCSKTAVTELMRIAWRTVGAVITRVWADVEALGDRLDGLTRIDIDEISYKP